MSCECITNRHVKFIVFCSVQHSGHKFELITECYPKHEKEIKTGLKQLKDKVVIGRSARSARKYQETNMRLCLTAYQSNKGFREYVVTAS